MPTVTQIRRSAPVTTTTPGEVTWLRVHKRHRQLARARHIARPTCTGSPSHPNADILRIKGGERPRRGAVSAVSPVGSLHWPATGIRARSNAIEQLCLPLRTNQHPWWVGRRTGKPSASRRRFWTGQSAGARRRGGGCGHGAEEVFEGESVLTTARRRTSDRTVDVAALLGRCPAPDRARLRTCRSAGCQPKSTL